MSFFKVIIVNKQKNIDEWWSLLYIYFIRLRKFLSYRERKCVLTPLFMRFYRIQQKNTKC